MASFSIDDVRETMTADVTAFLTRIEEASIRLSDATTPHPSGQPAPSFRAIEDAGHAIYGTSSLVGADSLAVSAKLIEELAVCGQEALELAAHHAERARRIASLALSGAAEMRGMLDLELDRRGDDAQWLAIDWQGRAQAVLTEPTLVTPPRNATTPAVPKPVTSMPPGDLEILGAVGEEDNDLRHATDVAEEAAPDFVFTDDAVPVATSPMMAFDDELQAVFQQEARECIVSLQGHLEALFGDPTDLVPARHLERLYHTLKGAAATVGLESVSAFAHQLQSRMQDVVERGARVTPELLELVVADTTLLLESAGLKGASFSPKRDEKAQSRGPADLRAGFREEVRIAYEESSAWIAQMSDDDGSFTDVRANLETLFHRLKGSALVVDARELSAEAARLQAECATGKPSRAELARGLARIAALAGVPGVPAVPAEHAPVIEADDDARATFALEARRICDEAEEIARSLEQSAQSGGLDTLETLGRLFHRLRGSALLIGETAIGEIATRLQAGCDGESMASMGPIHEGLQSIRDTLGGGSGPVAGSETLERHTLDAPDPELWQAFTQECAELLEAIDKTVLSLEESRAPEAELKKLLSPLHTLKGVVNTMGLTPTGKLLHRVEDFIDSLAAAKMLPPVRSIASFLLDVQAEVRRNLRQAKKGFVEVALAKLEARAARVLRSTSAKTSASRESRESESRQSQGESESRGDESASKATPERAFVRVATARLDGLMNLAGEAVVSRSRILSRVEALRALQLELGRGSRRLVETVEKFVEEHEFARMDAGAGTRAGSLALAAGAEWMSEPVASGSTRSTAKHGANGDAQDDSAWSAFGELELDRYQDIHILSRSLAELTNDFGEMYGQLAQGLGALTDDSDAFGGIVSGIQSEVTRARMVPLEVLYSRLRLPIRDAAHREEKEVRVVTEGEEVNLDKTIADGLFQPMLHLVRNAVAHGLEDAAGRARAGKQGTGVITLSARQELGQIILEVRDDGGGLDLVKLRDQGVALGLIPEGTDLDDPRVPELVFAAGLSTLTTARAVAGRGVGCDVVRRAVERLNGSAHVETTPGRGTRFVLTLPLTLAITKALLVEDAGQQFAIPLYFAERILDAHGLEIVESAGVRRVRLDGVWSPMQRLGALLGRHDAAATGPVVVLRIGTERTLLQVDAVRGQEEIVVKTLGSVLHGHPLFAGVTARGTGQMVLILDVPGLMESRTSRLQPMRKASPAAPMHGKMEKNEKFDKNEKNDKNDDAPASEPRRRKEKVEERSLASEQRKLRVMFVDDSLSVRKVAERALGAMGVEVTTAVDGLDALAKMREASFDLLFTDLEMPRMHGFELIRELRFIKAHQDLPIVVVTSRSGQKHQEQARILGANEYLTKPFTQQTLAAALEKWGRVREESAK